MARILDKIKVFDLSRAIAGPMAAMVLSGGGAGLIKIKGPEGNSNRESQLGYREVSAGPAI